MAAETALPAATSIIESTSLIPIAQLTPSLINPSSKALKAVVTLTWPYSSATDSLAFLLAEPDFRLRRTKGQVRVQFSGSSAQTVAKCGIASGDTIVLSLDGVEYIQHEVTISTPGKGVGFELKFTERLLLQFQQDGVHEVCTIDVDHPRPQLLQNGASTSTSLPLPAATEIPSTTVARDTHIRPELAAALDEFSSPAFSKRARTSYGSLFDGDFESDGYIHGKGRKRTRMSSSWRLSSRSPSPEIMEPENISRSFTPEPKPRPNMTDEGVQTISWEGDAIDMFSEFARQSTNVGRDVFSRTNGSVQLYEGVNFASNLANSPYVGMEHRHSNSTAPMPPQRSPSPGSLQPWSKINIMSTVSIPQAASGQVIGEGLVREDDSDDLYSASPTGNHGRKHISQPTEARERSEHDTRLSQIESSQHQEDAYGHWQADASQHSHVVSPHEAAVMIDSVEDPEVSHQENTYNNNSQPSLDLQQQYPDLEDINSGQHNFAWSGDSTVVAYPDLPEHVDNLDTLIRSLSQPRANSISISARSPVVDLTESSDEDDTSQTRHAPRDTLYYSPIQATAYLRTAEDSENDGVESGADEAIGVEKSSMHLPYIDQDAKSGSLEVETEDELANDRNRTREVSTESDPRSDIKYEYDKNDNRYSPGSFHRGQDNDKALKRHQDETYDLEEYEEYEEGDEEGEHDNDDDDDEDEDEETEQEFIDDEEGDRNEGRIPSLSQDNKKPVVIDLLSSDDEADDLSDPGPAAFSPKQTDIEESGDDDLSEEQSVDESLSGEESTDDHNEWHDNRKVISTAERDVAVELSDNEKDLRDATPAESIRDKINHRQTEHQSDAHMTDDTSSTKEQNEPTSISGDEEEPAETAPVKGLHSDEVDDLQGSEGTGISTRPITISKSIAMEKVAGSESIESREPKLDSPIKSLKDPLTSIHDASGVLKSRSNLELRETFDAENVDVLGVSGKVRDTAEEPMKKSRERPSLFARMFNLDGANDEPEDGVSYPSLSGVLEVDASHPALPPNESKLDQNITISKNQLSTSAQLPTPEATQLSQQQLSQGSGLSQHEANGIHERFPSDTVETTTETQTDHRISAMDSANVVPISHNTIQTETREYDGQPTLKLPADGVPPPIDNADGMLVSLIRVRSQSLDKLTPVKSAFTTDSPRRSSRITKSTSATTPKEHTIPTTPVNSSKATVTSPGDDNVHLGHNEELTYSQGHDASIELALSSLESPAKHHDLRSAPTIDLKIKLTRNLRTELEEFTALKVLRYHLNQKLDVIAIATTNPLQPQRVKSGPRHYLMTFHITDPSTAPSGVTEVQIFRPYREALPTVKAGDGILLRSFQVISVKNRGFALRSDAEGSSWAVFKDSEQTETRGPPVEYGQGEMKHVALLRLWFRNLDPTSQAKLERANTDKMAAGIAERKSPAKAAL